MLTATSLLAANVDEMLTALVDPIDGLGVDVTFNPAMPFEERCRSVNAGDVDVTWLCGLLAAKSLERGDMRGSVRLAPVFAGRRAPLYHSVIVARTGGPRGLDQAEGRVLAINEPESWSGHHALVELLGRRSLGMSMFSAVIHSGSHAASVRAVSRGDADLAAIDDSVWSWMASHDQIRGLHVVDRTPDWPAPPLVFGSAVSDEETERLEAAFRRLEPGQIAGVDRFVPAQQSDYASMLAITNGYEPRRRT